MDSMSNLGSLLEAKPGVVWDSISAAYLERTVLEEFLRKIFGILKPRVEVDDDYYYFAIPRLLTPDERTALYDKASQRTLRQFSSTYANSKPKANPWNYKRNDPDLKRDGFDLSQAPEIRSEQILSISRFSVLKKVSLANHSWLTNWGDKNVFALKSYPDSQRKYADYEKELAIYGVLQKKSRNVVRVLGFYKLDGTLNVLTEHANGGTLAQYFQYTLPPVTNRARYQFWTSLLQLSGVLVQLCGIPSRTRRTVNPSNILVFREESNSPYSCTFKLADYSLDAIENGPFFPDNTQAANVISLGYVYAEAIAWSLGAAALIEYKACWYDFDSFLKSYSNEIQASDEITRSVITLIQQMLHSSPAERPSADEVWDVSRKIMVVAHGHQFDAERYSQSQGLESDDSSGSIHSDEGSVFSFSSSMSTVSSLAEIADPNQAEDAFVDLFFRDAMLANACTVTVKNRVLSEKEFEKAMCHCLISFSKNLHTETKSEASGNTARFVRGHSHSISRKLWEKACSLSKIESLGDVPFQKGKNSYGSKVEARLDDMGATLKDEKGKLAVETDAGESNPSDSDDEDRRQEVLELTRLETLVRSSLAFATFRLEVQSLVYTPIKSAMGRWLIRQRALRYPEVSQKTQDWLSSLVHDLDLSIPGSINVSSREEKSVFNTIKALIEDQLGESWDWWPFKQRVRRLQPGQARVQWRCACGEELWEEVPNQFAKKLKKVIRRQMVQRRLTGPSPRQSMPGSATHARAPHSAQGLTSTAASIGAPGSRGQSSNKSLPQSHGMTPIGTRPHGTAPSAQPDYDKRYIFMVVSIGYDVGATFKLAQTETKNLTTNEFFQWLRLRFYELKGPTQTWFGLSDFSHCEFYKFQRFEEGEFEPLAEEFPNPNERGYFFNPKPMRPIPPIREHQFYRRFHACYRPRPHLHWFHHCKKYCSDREVLNFFPQRDTALQEDASNVEQFWGIYAKQKRSAFRVAIYQILFISPSIAFFFLWLFSWGHSSDLQNASIPVSITVTAATMFWGFVFLSSPAGQASG